MLKMRHLRHPLLAARRADSLFRLHGGALRTGLQGWRRYGSDSRFRRDLVIDGFRDRSESGNGDQKLIARICRSFEAASSISPPEPFGPTNWWIELRRSSLRSVLNALQAGDISALEGMYSNFFRDRCSDGLVGKSVLLDSTLPDPLRKAHQWAYISEALTRLDRWKTLTWDLYTYDDLSGPAIGNPFGVVLDDVLICPGAEHQHYGAKRIAGLLSETGGVAIDIGGGYGAMAYYLLRDHPSVTYWSFDLPETLALAAYFLIRSFPEKRILLFGEADRDESIVTNYDIVLMPISELTTVRSRSADIVFSSHAMSDLCPAALEIYLDCVADITKRYFLWQGMSPAAEMLRQLMRHNHPELMLEQATRYLLHGKERSDYLQSELLYKR
jgi:hypothetical protein